MSEAPIESRQLIGWWRDAVSDAITSSAYTGERTIHSSDFSAFTKRSHCPSLLRFSGPNLYSAIIHLHFGDCLSGTLFSSWWSAMEYRRCQPPCARFIAREDPHSKCIKCLGFSHARDAVYGTSKCKICIWTWDLSVVLEGLVTAPFEPLESASERILTLKVTLLLALTSLKRVGDLQAFSVSETCMDFAPGLVKVTLWPRLGYILKVLSTLFRSQVVTLHPFHPPPLLQVRMRDSTCSARSGHWSCMWIAPRFGENPPSYWSVLVLAAAGLPHRNRGFLTGWETPFRWLMRRGTSLHLLVFGRILLGA